MTSIITVDKLGKKYTLFHKKKVPYLALRDVMASSLKKMTNKLLNPLRDKDNRDAVHEDFWALKDISVEIKVGDRVAIIGRNGSGKSTLLKILSRITEPTTGSAIIEGRTASLLEVGTGFHPELTGRENIYLNGAILGMHKAEIKQKFDEIVAFADVEKFLDTPVKHYSSGMYVRLAFAVAAHLEPEILIVDEVLAVGDAQFQKKCIGKMEQTAREGRTILFVSHNMAAVRQLCQYGIWLERGQIKEQGLAANVVESYLTSGTEAAGERRWNDDDAHPGNDKIRLRAVRVKNVDGEIATLLDMTKPFYVEIEYDVLQAYTGLRTGFWIYTIDGVLVFVAGDSVAVGWTGKKRPSGRYISVCKIPGMLLNSGRYSLTVATDIQGAEILFVEQYVLSFQLEHTGYSELDGANRSAGIICPSLEWTISQLSV